MTKQNGTAPVEPPSSGLAIPRVGVRGMTRTQTREERLDVVALTSWMLKQSDQERAGRRCVLFTLAHRGEKNLTGMTEGEVLRSLGDRDREIRVAEIVRDFEYASGEWVKGGSRGPQSFVVGGHRDENPETDAHITFPFTVTPPPEMAENFEGAEKPTPAGEHAQLMRIVDTLLRLKSADDQRDKDRMVELHRIDREHIRDLSEIREAATKEREILADGAALRAAQLHKAQLDIELQHKLVMKAIEIFGPKLAEAVGAPQGDNPMIPFVLSLEPERIAALVKDLTPEQKALADPVLTVLLDKLPDDKKGAIFSAMTASDIEITEVKREDEE